MYAATVAGISYNIEASAQGLQIQLIGYNQHMNLCVKDVADTIEYLAKVKLKVISLALRAPTRSLRQRVEKLG